MRLVPLRSALPPSPLAVALSLLLSAAVAAPAPAALPQAIEYRGEQIVLDLDVVSPFRSEFVSCKLTVTYPRGGGGFGLAKAWSDSSGRVTVAFDATGLETVDTVTVALWCPEGDTVVDIPTTELPGVDPCEPENVEPNEPVTTCSSCPDCGPGLSELFEPSNEPTAFGTYLQDGTLRDDVPVLSFDTRLMGLDYGLNYATQVVCDGPQGQGWRSSYDDAIVQTAPHRAFYVTSDLQAFPIATLRVLTGFPLVGPDLRTETVWLPPEGFFSGLQRDEHLNRWLLTHHTGVEYEFFVGALGRPGGLTAVREPNGNHTAVRRNASGAIASLVSDLGQEVRFTYGDDGRVAAVTDHIGRRWSFGYDELGNLVTITTPDSEFADVGPGVEITDGDLPEVLVERGRTTRFSYDDPLLPHHLTRITDQRGAVPIEYGYHHDPPHLGKVRTKTINGRQVTYLYDPPPDAVPAPLPPLDPGNRLTRVIDREGNVTDYEMHGAAGGPLGGRGRFGLRRTVTWTERGKGDAPLRAGEPLAWERRWLQDCDCLAPREVSQPFRYEGAGRYVDDRGETVEFDALGMPVNAPNEVFTYNDRRQVTAYEYRGHTPDESIRWEKSYAGFRAFSRELTYTEPRGFDDSPIYADLGPGDFTHSYVYDARGNRIRHDAPDARRGLDGGPQAVTERWSYDQHGRVLSHTDPNGNRTTYAYFPGDSTGGDVNTQGAFGGYLASMTRGAAGSANPAPELTTRYRVNALGMVTRRTDPRGLVHETVYNDLGETVRELEPEVTLHEGRRVRYETRHVYDGAGNRVLRRRSNVDLDGAVAANAFIDRSQSFDAVGNLLSSRVEVNGNDADDLITRYRYDRNDQLAVVVQPEGNRTFHVYDERRLRFKTFYGIAPSAGGEPAEAYPADKTAEALGATDFVGSTATTYDARRNATRMRDGRGHLTHHHYDFFNRRVATSDPNGNGMTYLYDDASKVLTTEGGAVSADTGEVTGLQERSYSRFDELGRRYQHVLDVDLATDESARLDANPGPSSEFNTVFDAGSRVVVRRDANGNPTATSYDAADRTLAVTDALGNVRSFVYDANSNVVRIEELELPGPGADGVPETYVTTHVYDELDRRTETHVRGLNGDSIDHQTLFAHDSRHNTRLVIDAEGKATRTTFDDLDRVVLTQRFSADPGARGVPDGVTELIHYEYRYDRNSRKTHDIARSDVNDPATSQATLYLYDHLDRLVTTVYPDADDLRQAPDGPGYLEIDPTNPDGADGIYDRVTVAYDENSNVVRTKEQREVVFHNSYDPGDRLTVQAIDLPPSVPGTDRQEYAYDALNRLTEATNNYSRVSRSYDPLSRLTMERQEIRLDGSGYENGWERPVDLHYEYDRQSNRTRVLVKGPEGQTDLDTRHGYDALNRMVDIDAAYFDQTMHDIANYTFLGPWRVLQKRYGNGAVLTRGYDAKRRVASHIWTDGTEDDELLVGFEYDYDDVDNPLYERFLHDDRVYDTYEYNDRYELSGVTYRTPKAVDYRVDPEAFESTFDYDDNFNRRASDAGDPLHQEPNLKISYNTNKMNEYTDVAILGSKGLVDVANDRAGNMTKLPTRPTVGSNAGNIVQLDATWDAYNLMFSASVPDAGQGREFVTEYRYDPLRRRIGKLVELVPSDPGRKIRRYIWDGWSVVTERSNTSFNRKSGPTSIRADLERIYVNGSALDHPLLMGLSDLPNSSESLGESKGYNQSSTTKSFYYLNNRLLSIAAIMSRQTNKIALRNRYDVFGNALSICRSGGSCDPSLNVYMYAGRRFDPESGLYYFRMRYQVPLIGRFAARDPEVSYFLEMLINNAYPYGANRPTHFVDPLGEKPSKPELNCPGPDPCKGNKCSFHVDLTGSKDESACNGKGGFKDVVLRMTFGSSDTNCCLADIDREVIAGAGFVEWTLCDGTECRMTEKQFLPGSAFPLDPNQFDDENAPPEGRKPLSTKCFGSIEVKAEPRDADEQGGGGYHFSEVREIHAAFTLRTFCTCTATDPEEREAGTVQYEEWLPRKPAAAGGVRREPGQPPID